MSKNWRVLFAFLVSGVILVFVAAFQILDSRFHLVFCDVGQGDAILAYRGSTQILVDGGPDKSVLACLEDHMPFWDRKIELAILTNPDKDHYAGLIEVIRRYQIITYSSSGIDKEGAGMDALEAELKKQSVRIVDLELGDQLNLGKVKLYTLWPTREWLARAKNLESGIENLVLGATDSPNEFSVVVKLSYGEFDALLTGDIEPPATNVVALSLDEGRPTSLRELRGVNWEVLKVPHHGSKNGLTQRLLDAVNPQLAVISVGKNNRYGHPHAETLALLRNYVTTLLRTDLDGEIEIVTDGNRLWKNPDKR